MARKRKTIDFEQFRQWINEQLARTDDYALENPEFKAGICNTFERFATDTGNYHGFQYLYWMEKGCDEWNAAGIPDDHAHWKEKDLYINGTSDSKYGGNTYARVYY